MKKTLSLLFAVIATLIVVWLGASFYSARMAGNYVTSLPERYKQNDHIHIKTIEHHQSVFSSNGKFEIRFPNYIPRDQQAPTAIGLIVEYKISNLLLPDSAGRLEWKMTGDEAIDPLLKQLFGQGPTMQGKGFIRYSGQRQSSVELSELLFKDAQSSLKLTPLSGQATWDNETLQLKLKSAHLDARTEGSVTEWHGMSIDINLSNRNLGIGTYVFDIEKGATISSRFEGMKITKIASLVNDRFNFAITQTIKQYSFDKIKLSDVDQEFLLSGIDKESVMAISSIFRDAKDVNTLSAEERIKMSIALRNLFNKGFSFGIPRLSTKIDGGTLTGKLNVEVLKADGADIAFSTAQRLRASGNIDLTGRGGLDNTQRMTALMLGLAVKTPEGLQTSFEFSNGVIKANGKTFDIKDNLKFLDNVVNGVLTP
ncbi:DUF945 family protein [Zwartia vadi]|uniref:DUF945 family protein n=1 Tax=Zwartia vadi TaxID=3058168 RepID=UPI0025B5442E|nr:DUF945 family protein [Zwartia vadi]MDN3986456.1 DUF945 family protein [Zwartia vadi]